MKFDIYCTFPTNDSVILILWEGDSSSSVAWLNINLIKTKAMKAVWRFEWEWALQVHILERLVLSWCNYLGRIQRWGCLAGEGVSPNMDFEISNPSFPPHHSQLPPTFNHIIPSSCLSPPPSHRSSRAPSAVPATRPFLCHHEPRNHKSQITHFFK